jgi:hypothetical protein
MQVVVNEHFYSERIGALSGEAVVATPAVTAPRNLARGGVSRIKCGNSFVSTTPSGAKKW